MHARSFLFPLTLTLATSLVACDSRDKDGDMDAEAMPGLSSLVSLNDEAAGENCANGGTRIDQGVDANRDGVLSADEVDSTDYVCNGEAGQSGTDATSYITTLTDEPAGDNCENGGFLVETGPDADRDGVIDDVVTSTYSCFPAPPADAVVVIDTAYVGSATEACPGGFVNVEFGYDLDGSGSVEGAEIITSLITCNATPVVETESLTLVEDCTTDIVLPFTAYDVDGAVADLAVTVDVSGSAITPTISADGTVTIPAGSHQSGAILTVTATDNYGASSEAQMIVGFVGTGCLPTDTFYGINPDFCEEIDVNGLVGDDRGGIVLTQNYAFYNGDEGVVRTNLDLSDPTEVAPGSDVDTLMADPIGGGLYSLWSSDFTFTNVAVAGDELDSYQDYDTTSWDQLVRLDEDTLEVLSVVTLDMPVIPATNYADVDFGAGSESVRGAGYVLGMRDGHMVVSTRFDTDVDSVIQTRLIDVATGADLGTHVVRSDDATFELHAWETQETSGQHYLLLERAGSWYLTYLTNYDGSTMEKNVLTGELTVRSTSFATSTDTHNLAVDGSGLFAYVHDEGGFAAYASESMTRCLVLFGPNDGTYDDSGT